MHKKAVYKFARDIERILGVPRVAGRAANGWRRALVGVMNEWSLDPKVKDLLTGHTKLTPFTHGDTRESMYADPADLPRLREAQRLQAHLRGVFARTGESPPK